MSLNFDRALLQKSVTGDEYIKLYTVIMLYSYSDLLQMNTVGKNSHGLFSFTFSWAQHVGLRAPTLEIQVCLRDSPVMNLLWRSLLTCAWLGCEAWFSLTLRWLHLYIRFKLLHSSPQLLTWCAAGKNWQHLCRPHWNVSRTSEHARSGKASRAA